MAVNDRERQDAFWSGVERLLRAGVRHAAWTLVVCPACVTTQLVVTARDVPHAVAGIFSGMLFGGVFGVALFLGLAPAAVLQFRANWDPSPRRHERRTRLGPVAARYGANALVVVVGLASVMYSGWEGVSAFLDSIAQGPDSAPRAASPRAFDTSVLIWLARSVAGRIAAPLALGVLIEWVSANQGWISARWTGGASHPLRDDPPR